MEIVNGVCACACVCWWVMTHLSPLVQRFYGEGVGSYVNDHAQLEPIGGVGRPHWLPILHGSPPVSNSTQLGEGEETEKGGE